MMKFSNAWSFYCIWQEARSLPLLPLGFMVSLVFTTVAVSADSFEQSILPLLTSRCVTCHSAAEPKGELDLERFSSVAEIKKHSQIWESVLEQLANNEMPPKDQPQLSPHQKTTLTTWIQGVLDEVALASANDPGPIVLRRLSNREYAYTISDLTGIDSLDPTQEFPVDGAAGEGFTNVGAALVMSPSLLTKYLDAAKEVAAHAVLLPDGIRFSPSTSARDWANENLAMIRDFYARYTESGGGTAMNLQGVKFDTNGGGRLPVERYFSALVAERDAVQNGKSLKEVAASHQLNEKYLRALWEALTSTDPSLALEPIRARFQTATPQDISALTQMVHDWQQALWRFTSVGHIGKVNGPQAWQEPVSPLVSQQEMRLKLEPPAEADAVTFYLAVSDAGDGNAEDFALWENARLVTPGRKDLPLKHLSGFVRQLGQLQEAVRAEAAQCLVACDQIEKTQDPVDLLTTAKEHKVTPVLLQGWLDYLGIGSQDSARLGPLIEQQSTLPDYSFIQGWVGADALSVLANSSDASVNIPGTMKPHSIATHPSPTLASVIAWRSPVAGSLQVTGNVQDAHTACGNGVTWSLETRRGKSREVLASGTTTAGNLSDLGTLSPVSFQSGDVLALVIGPRDGSHVCDLTTVNLTIRHEDLEWDLAKEVSPNILAGNPHGDSHGNADVWYFFSEPASAEAVSSIPAGSLLAQWRGTEDSQERAKLAAQVQSLLNQGVASLEPNAPDRKFYNDLLSMSGSLLAPGLRAFGDPSETDPASAFGVDPAKFGVHPQGKTVDPQSLCVQAPSVIEVTLPAMLAVGAEVVVSGRLHPEVGTDASVQMQVLAARPEISQGLAASKSLNTQAKGAWTDNNLRTSYSAPVLVRDGSAAKQRFEMAFDAFRQLFPRALCYTQIVPVDEVVTLRLYHREDTHLQRLMLTEEESRQLDRLWDQLHFISESPLKQVDSFEQLFQYATQDADPSAFAPLREPIAKKAADFKQQQRNAEPFNVRAVLEFAAKAWRRPLTSQEQTDAQELYLQLRQQTLPHDVSVRTLLARVLVAPAFLYRGEKSRPGNTSSPLSDWELATRLSYFLWSSTPDEELMRLAEAGRLRDSQVLLEQVQRMVKSDKIRRLATEFGCQWLHVRDVDQLDEKSERHFPSFIALRADMQEEVVRFFVDLLQQDRSILSLLTADHSFLNKPLAAHYGITFPAQDANREVWQRVEGLRNHGRGGILGFAATLSKQSGASRTSPILRGNWLSEVVLGERLPRPPKDVPVLPEEAPEGLTERQLIERHSSDPKCAGCHQRIDPMGFALEGFDAIGRQRQADAAGLPIDARATLLGGEQIDGVDGLRNYLLNLRGEDFQRQFCRKLLGYALGRSVQLSDKPLVDQMLVKLKANEYRVSAILELIVLSPQFREIRGLEYLASH